MSIVHKVILPIDQEWVDINTSTGIAVGKAITIQNTGTAWVQIAESTTEPTDPAFHKVITSLTYPSPEATVLQGALKVWARSSLGSSAAIIAVQEV